MCLSSAYAVGDGAEELICDRIINLSIDNGKIRLTNLLGVQTIVEGELKSIDLNNNVIRIWKK